MSKFSYTFESRYSLDTYEDVINTYYWLSQCFKYAFLDIDTLKLSSSFSFSANQIDYECSSIEEFKENAFGLNIKPETLFVCAKDAKAYFSDTLAHFWTRRNPEEKKVNIVLSSDEKKYLISLKDALTMDQSILIKSIDKKAKPVPENESSIGTAVIHSSAISNPKPQKEHKETWYSKLFWQIVIPIAVTVIAAIIVWRLGFN
ncbi:MAG: hypothetical protein PHV71_08165 [Eubacteriales bacterium]|nr:hypothetical protein [Eubacteriales bacterium]MDD4630542.1 hypothetical protein [Eubacteriales bacterium]